MKYLRECRAEDLKGKRVLLRLDFNVSIVDGKIVDDYRIKRSMPTLQFLRSAGAKTIIVSHIESEGVSSLKIVHEHLAKVFDVIFVPEYFTQTSETALGTLEDGGVALMENVRINAGEKINDESFSEQLAGLADIYVNDAFAVSHRSHASVVGVSKFLPSYAGFLFEDEIKNLSVAEKPEHPFVFILGGAKLETKLPLVERFLNKANLVFLGGALSNTIFSCYGYNVGKSSFSKLQNCSLFIGNPTIAIPVDVITVEDGKESEVKRPYGLHDNDKIMDAGPESIGQLVEAIKKAKFVLWNGPLGLYEAGFKDGTLAVARAIAESGAHSVVGGGDTLAAISELGLEDKFTFVSTGGGAMLDFLAKGTLPGIQALENSL